MAEYVQKKKSRVKQTEELVEKLSLFLPSQPGHSKLELELAGEMSSGTGTASLGINKSEECRQWER